MFEPALEYHILYSNWKDSMLNESNQNAIRDIEGKYEAEKKEREIELLTKKQELSDLSLAQSRYFNWGLTILSVLTLAFLTLFINRFLSKKRTAAVLSKQNFEIQEQKTIIEEKNKDITDSIHYAGKIQNAILPDVLEFKKHFADSFVIFKPRDIVSGDFTWIVEKDGRIFFTAADCTGHGVPGALVSVMCSNALNRCVKELGITSPGKILDKTVEILEEHFSGSGESGVMDGMDLAFCVYEPKKNQLTFSGANNPLFILQSGNFSEIKGEIAEGSVVEIANGAMRDNELHLGNFSEIKGDKQPVGKFAGRKPFTDHIIKTNPGDTLFLFTDGLADQFGGPKGKKFKNAQFRELLQMSGSRNMKSIGDLIENTLRDWQGSMEQVDDICVVGVRL